MKQPAAPDKIFEELFVDLHASKLWSDGKIIADALPLATPEVILTAYQKSETTRILTLKHFLKNTLNRIRHSQHSLKATPIVQCVNISNAYGTY